MAKKTLFNMSSEERRQALRTPGWYVVCDEEDGMGDHPAYWGPYENRREAMSANRKFYADEGAVIYDGGKAETRALMASC